MNLRKHSIIFGGSVAGALGLLAVAVWFAWSGWGNHSRQRVELNRQQGEWQRLTVATAEPAGVWVEQVQLRCRAVDQGGVVAGANEQMAYVLDAELKRSRLFSEVKLDPQIGQAGPAGTFTIGVNVRLKQPMRIAAAGN